jgi:hypothetical protein
MKSSFLPKYEQKIVKISALTTQGRNPDKYPGPKVTLHKHQNSPS